jgi:anti-sigma-K factor RskA
MTSGTEIDIEAQAEPAPTRARPTGIWGRAGLWRAIAGMAITFAAASAIVTLEFSHSLVIRTRAMNRRIGGLNSTVRQLRAQKSVAEKKLGTASVRAGEGEIFARLLFAPDLRIARLAPSADAGHAASAVLAVSESANAAMIEVAGARTSPQGKVYRIWYVPRRGLAVWITDFIVGDDGKATAALELPAQQKTAAQIVVTLEDQEYAEAPAAAVEFKGRLREEERTRR